MNQKIDQQKAFKSRIDDSLSQPQVRQNFRGAMDSLMEKRLLQFPKNIPLQNLRQSAQKIRQHALKNLPDLLEQLETNLIKNGIKVHWAKTDIEACTIIEQILSDANAKKIVKGKSMVSEEIALNHYLEQRSYQVIESDLGEFIIQLAGETPSHIVMPAIHKNKREIAHLLHRHFPAYPYSEDVDTLTQQARAILREHFFSADAGISGVNFLVAESGTLCLVENEGNGRMCTTVPPLHIAVTGIEKVVERLTDVPDLLDVLTKSATGQPITTYFNLISSPRKKDEKDGPDAVHLVLVDNGRSSIYRHHEFLETLQCIRCGCCINHCPVYVQLGGHAYGTTYPGPIGTVLEPMRQGLDKIGTLTSACSLCGACGEVCPVHIPLPQLINQLRAEAVEMNALPNAVTGTGSMRTRLEAGLFGLWRWVNTNPWRLKTAYKLARWMRLLIINPHVGWGRYRHIPKPAKQTLMMLAKKEGFANE